MSPGKEQTILDIARRAGVSIATISRAINPDTRHKVADETLDRIDQVVERFGYTPNLAARHMRSTQFKTIGLLIPHIENVFLSDYYAKVFSGFSNALMHSDYRFKIVALRPYVRKWDKYPFRTAEGIDGLVVDYWPTFFTKKFDVDLPCVIITDPDPDVKAHFVSADNVAGGEMAARLLYDHGHERIAILRGHTWSTDSDLRIKGFRRFMSKVGTAVPQEMIFTADYEEDRAAKVVERLFLEHKNITAIFCCNDNMAYGAIKKMKQLGMRCPEDVSVIGFDDESRAASSDPPLTTVRVHTQELGRMGAEKMVDFLRGKINKQDFYGQETTLPVSLVERKSVGRVR